ncbi:calcineurin B-like protein 1 [Rosa chinensis]|uniref:calcineurin B-like protein 1 n=1 Tax=Rosa chinensis TaxID=74649 RepID=UPI001AD93472|nr:calcineurin B-like protein 1 [Rosa chinensis]
MITPLVFSRSYVMLAIAGLSPSILKCSPVALNCNERGLGLANGAPELYGSRLQKVCESYVAQLQLCQVKEMVLPLLRESELALTNDVIESIVDKTMMEAALKGDGKIDQEEWKEYVAKHP